MNPSSNKIGVIGLGLMGTAMAKRLLKFGYTVNVWNRSPEKAHALSELGAAHCTGVSEVVQQSNAVVLSLTDTAAVEKVVFGDGGIASISGRSKTLIDTSSIEPGATQRFAERLLQQSGMTWIDAPVSGGVTGANTGSLSFMMGGSVAAIDNMMPVLKCLGQRFTHMGPNGAGQTTKILNQIIVGCNAVAIAEVMALAKKSDVDATKIAEAFGGGFADSKPLQLMAPRMASDNFSPVQWHVATLIKDLKQAENLAENLDQQISISKEALRCMLQRGPEGMDTDLSTLVKIYE